MAKTILITGSSSGIGRATARYFQEQGWNVVATMRTPEKETELNQLDNVLVTRLDVQDEASIENAVKESIERFGKIDVLLNNAGYGLGGPLEAMSMDKIRRQFDVNVFGLIASMKALIPHFRENKDGVIINVSSVGGRMSFPFFTQYHGTKFAVEGISEALSYEMGTIGVRMKIVEPGAIKTDFVDRSMDLVNDESLAEYQGLMQSFSAAMGGDMMANASEPELVAEVIYTAATDGTDQLRYLAGADAEQYMANRDSQDDATFLGGIKQMFGLTEMAK